MPGGLGSIAQIGSFSLIRVGNGVVGSGWISLYFFFLQQKYSKGSKQLSKQRGRHKASSHQGNFLAMAGLGGAGVLGVGAHSTSTVARSGAFHSRIGPGLLITSVSVCTMTGIGGGASSMVSTSSTTSTTSTGGGGGKARGGGGGHMGGIGRRTWTGGCTDLVTTRGGGGGGGSGIHTFC